MRTDRRYRKRKSDPADQRSSGKSRAGNRLQETARRIATIPVDAAPAGITTVGGEEHPRPFCFMRGYIPAILMHCLYRLGLRSIRFSGRTAGQPGRENGHSPSTGVYPPNATSADLADRSQRSRTGQNQRQGSVDCPEMGSSKAIDDQCRPHQRDDTRPAPSKRTAAIMPAVVCQSSGIAIATVAVRTRSRSDGLRKFGHQGRSQ